MRTRGVTAAVLVTLLMAVGCTSEGGGDPEAGDNTSISDPLAAARDTPTRAGETAATSTAPTGDPNRPAVASTSEAELETPAPQPSAPDPHVEDAVQMPAPLRSQIDGLVATVESIRELEFVTPPTVRALAPEDVVARRAASLRDELAGNDFAPEEALFQLFGVFQEPVDLETFYTDFYSSSTIAYYDLDDHELVVPITGEVLTPYEQWIMVHELTHALLDQRFPEVTGAYLRLSDSDRLDAAGGLLGLIEGEAVLVQSLFFETLDSEQRAELRRQADARRNATFAAAPAFFRALSRFPYTDGSLFTLYLYQRGGMDAVNRAYADPPQSTEEIYVPELFVDGVDVIVPQLRITAPFGFEVVERGAWGARGWRTLFGQFLNGGTAAEAAEGWGGDAYAVLWNAETHQIAFVTLFVGDTVRDAAEFGGAVEDFVAAAMDVELRHAQLRTTWFTGPDYAFVERVDDRTLFIAASDEVTGAAVRNGVVGFSG